MLGNQRPRPITKLKTQPAAPTHASPSLGVSNTVVGPATHLGLEWPKTSTSAMPAPKGWKACIQMVTTLCCTVCVLLLRAALLPRGAVAATADQAVPSQQSTTSTMSCCTALRTCDHHLYIPSALIALIITVWHINTHLSVCTSVVHGCAPSKRSADQATTTVCI